MKTFSLKALPLVLFGALVSTSGVAQEQTSEFGSLLIAKNNYSGFTMADYARSETCKVYSKHVVITKTYGAMDGRAIKKEEVVNLETSEGIVAVIQAAEQEELLTEQSYICDAPGTNIVAYNGDQELSLFSAGGCGGLTGKREGPMSQILIEVIDQYCPTTHDYEVLDVPPGFPKEDRTPILETN